MEYGNVKETRITARNNFKKNSATPLKLKMGIISATTAPKIDARKTNRHFALRTKEVVLNMRKSIIKF